MSLRSTLNIIKCEQYLYHVEYMKLVVRPKYMFQRRKILKKDISVFTF